MTNTLTQLAGKKQKYTNQKYEEVLKNKNYEKVSNVKELQTLTNQYNQKIDKLLIREEELNLNIKQKQKSIDENRDEIRKRKLHNEQITPASVNRDLHTKENLLEKKVVKYSTVHSENIEIRNKIDALRREKHLFT